MPLVKHLAVFLCRIRKTGINHGIRIFYRRLSSLGFSHKAVGFLVCEYNFVIIQIGNTVKFMTELPDVFITFDKMSVLSGPDDFKK